MADFMKVRPKNGMELDTIPIQHLGNSGNEKLLAGNKVKWNLR